MSDDAKKSEPQEYNEGHLEGAISIPEYEILRNINKYVKNKNEEIIVEDVCASFQEAVVEVLSQKAIKAAKEKCYNTITLAGGVACNSALRDKLTELGKQNNINIKYENISVDKYVIMPNHIHLIIFIYGTMKASSPTKNVQSIVRSLKKMVTKEIGHSIWQRSYHDHIIRGEKDYRKIWEYVDTNVIRWEKDCFYNNENEQ